MSGLEERFLLRKVGTQKLDELCTFIERRIAARSMEAKQMGDLLDGLREFRKYLPRELPTVAEMALGEAVSALRKELTREH